MTLDNSVTLPNTSDNNIVAFSEATTESKLKILINQ